MPFPENQARALRLLTQKASAIWYLDFTPPEDDEDLGLCICLDGETQEVRTFLPSVDLDDEMLEFLRWAMEDPPRGEACRPGKIVLNDPQALKFISEAMKGINVPVVVEPFPKDIQEALYEARPEVVLEFLLNVALPPDADDDDLQRMVECMAELEEAAPWERYPHETFFRVDGMASGPVMLTFLKQDEWWGLGVAYLDTLEPGKPPVKEESVEDRMVWIMFEGNRLMGFEGEMPRIGHLDRGFDNTDELNLTLAACEVALELGSGTVTLPAELSLVRFTDQPKRVTVSSLGSTAPPPLHPRR